MFMFCRELCFNKIPVINLAGKSDQQLIWEAIGYSEWKANLTLIKCASGNNSCSHTYRERIYCSIKAFKIRNVKKKTKHAILKEWESIQTIVNEHIWQN